MATVEKSIEEKNKEMIRWYVANVLSKGDMETLLKVFAEDCVDHDAPPGIPPGIEGVRMWFTMFFAGFPGATARILDMVAEGNFVCFQGEITAKHTGAFLGIPPTNNDLKVPVLEVVRIVDGQIKEHWGGVDTFMMMQQLGVIPPLG
jgi:predicted ester cyclase